eukprot:Hpha_TRINITY_DN16246_c1_g6::TRINITY_DN16246_c1_g6_i2::g.13060::m.13060
MGATISGAVRASAARCADAASVAHEALGDVRGPHPNFGGSEGRFSAGWCFGLYPLRGLRPCPSPIPLRDPGPWSRGRVEAATPVVSPSSPVDNLSFDIAAGLADVPTWTNSAGGGTLGLALTATRGAEAASLERGERCTEDSEDSVRGGGGGMTEDRRDVPTDAGARCAPTGVIPLKVEATRPAETPEGRRRPGGAAQAGAERSGAE